MLLLIKYTLLYGIVLMLVALGGMFSEHSGIINIALEGIMVIGGVAGVLTLTMLPESLPAFATVIIAVLAAAIAGMVYSLLLAFASINLKADQTIGGTALNLLATAVAVVISKNFSDSGSAKLNYSNKPFLFSIGGLELSIFVPLGIALLIISYIVLYKTRFGLRLRACGDNPHAVDAAGRQVGQIRLAAIMICGALSGLGGICFAYSISANFSSSIYVGYGYLAIAALIFGNWRILPTLGACLLFGFARSGGYRLVQVLQMPSSYQDLVMILPYVLTLLLLVFFSKQNGAPRALGVIYDKGAR